MAPFFSIIVPDFYPAVSQHRRMLCIASLQSSSFADFECIWLHDGEIDEDQENEIRSHFGSDERFLFEATRSRADDWGHSLRDMGIKAAKGKYIINLNADNLLYKHALEELHRYAHNQPLEGTHLLPDGTERLFCTNPEVLIFAVRMMGCVSLPGIDGITRFKGWEDKLQLVLPGWPPHRYNIDVMQLVATREIWLNEGGWWDKSEESDGNLLPTIAQKYGYLVIPEILGEHY